MVERIIDIEQASAWLEGLINYERSPSYANARFDLAPIRRLLDRLGNPQSSLSIIHVAGSKGKGSTCLLAEAVLMAAGERVGTFTSPHLESWCERFRLEGAPVKGPVLAEAVECVRPHVEALRAEDPEHAPTFFDATTATALVLFARAGVARVLLEVGLGGRLDSTNAVQPAVTCVTQIELEHTDKLGGTLALIAGEKAGIIKAGVPCVVGRLPAEAQEVVARHAQAVGAPLICLGEQFDAQPLVSSEWGSYEIGPGVRQAFRYRESAGFELVSGLGAFGRHQIDNAAIALAALRQLASPAGPPSVEAIQRGLAGASLPGRLELLGEKPWLLVDSAHTGNSSRAVRETMGELPARRRHLVLSISRDKASKAILDELLGDVQAIWITRAEPIRSMDPDQLAARCRDLAPHLEIHRQEDPEVAVRSARASLEADDLLCCTGSVYLAGIARRVLRAPGPAGPR